MRGKIVRVPIENPLLTITRKLRGGAKYIEDLFTRISTIYATILVGMWQYHGIMDL